MEGILGTAGHIDHGKTTLIEALTGRNTDTLKEEKERGITINLGYTHLDLNGKRYGIIDVPGHEKLIKNMLAGVFGMDLILLVVAADDGVMPQTLEHLEILRYLKKEEILPVITKCDRVSSERILEVEQEIRELGLPKPVHYSKGSKPLEVLEGIERSLTHKRMEGQVRYPVDRTFSKTGLGTILTGTLLSGTIRPGDTLISIPGLEEVKVRGMEAHHEVVEVATHGRVALQVKTKDKIERGHMLVSTVPTFKSRVLDVKIDNPKKHLFYSLKEYHYHLYSSKFVVTLKLFGKTRTKEESFYAQLLFLEDVYMEAHDLGILRTLNPPKTVAGVEVIRPLGEFISRKDHSYLDLLKQKDASEYELLVTNLLFRKKYMKISDLKKEIPELSETDYLSQPRIKDMLFSEDFLVSLEKEIKTLVKQYHKEHPYKKGIPFATLKKEVFSTSEKECFKELLIGFGYVVTDVVRLESFEIVISENHKKVMERLLKETSSFQPLKRGELIQTALDQEVLEALIHQEKIVKLDESLYLNQETVANLESIVKAYLKVHKNISIQQAKDLLETTRSFVVPMLEYLDQTKVTSRIPGGRILRSQ